MKNIFCFGDSLTRGSWDSEGGWTARLRKELDTKFINSGGNDPNYFQNLFNLGVSSRQLQELLNRFDNETKVRIRKEVENIFVFMVGMVDSALDAQNELPVTTNEQYLALLSQLLDQTQAFGNKILFVGLPPVDEDRVNSPDRIKRLGKKYFNDRVAELDNLTSQFCQSNGLPKVEINKTMRQMDYKSFIFDGIHPNDRGHEWIYEQVREPFLEMYGI
jgi:lysophospholipase L1-like esterase